MCVCVYVCFHAWHTKINAILGPASSFRDPPLAAKVMVSRVRTDKVRSLGSKRFPQLEDREWLLINHKHSRVLTSFNKVTLRSEDRQTRTDRYLVQTDRQAAQPIDQEEGLKMRRDEKLRQQVTSDIIKICLINVKGTVEPLQSADLFSHVPCLKDLNLTLRHLCVY